MKFIKSRRKSEPKAGWISVEDALPKESGKYIVFLSTLGVTEMSFSTRYQKFNCRDDSAPNIASDTVIDTVAYWMHMPDPPEELR